MFPLLYPASADLVIYEYNGYGFFNTCTQCDITEERNGEYILEMTISPSDNLAKTVSIGMIIKAKANQYDNPQLFYICQIVVDKIGNISIIANHVKYLHFQNCTLSESGFYSITANPKTIMNTLFEGLAFDNLFEFDSDITDEKEFVSGYSSVKKLGDVYGGSDGSLLDIFGGEYHFDNFKVELKKSRGRSTNYQVRFGSNISDYNQTITNDNVYTHIVFFAKIKAIDFVEKEYEIALEPMSTGLARTFKNVKKVDFTSEMSDYEVKPSTGLGYDDAKKQLQVLANEYLSKNTFTTEEVNITVTYMPELDNLQDIRLCDTVTVVHGKLGATTKSKVTKVVYDSIHERYKSVEFGEAKISLKNFIKNNRR